MHLADLIAAMEAIAPPALAESWDNVGLLAGNPAEPLTGPVLLAIDLTEPVLAEAVAAKASAIIAYHPPIWNPLKRITAETVTGRILLGAVRHGIAIYSPHTALDAVSAGVTDWLCEGLSGSTQEGKIAGDCRALLPHERQPFTQQVKIATFVPETEIETLRQAMASAGAGIIGDYRVCSFATRGTGTFLGGEGTAPTVGQPGRLEHVEELRLEMVCSKAALALALETLREFHPYEEPAIDVYELLPHPTRHSGPGRRLVLDQPVTLDELAARLKAHLGITTLSLARPDNPTGELITSVGVCPGSGASLAPAAAELDCDLFVTGEMKHHEVLDALCRGMAVLLAGHTNTERGYLPRLARRLQERLPGARTIVSLTDRSPRVPV